MRDGTRAARRTRARHAAGPFPRGGCAVGADVLEAEWSEAGLAARTKAGSQQWTAGDGHRDTLRWMAAAVTETAPPPEALLAPEDNGVLGDVLARLGLS